MPKHEYIKTAQYIRSSLWAEWRKFREKRELPGIGIILSDVLMQEELYEGIGKPIIFFQQYEKYHKTPKWMQRTFQL